MYSKVQSGIHLLWAYRHWLLQLSGLGLLSLILGILFRPHLIAQTLKISAPQFRIKVKQNIRVPMRDGITLATDHYAPLTSRPLPTILIRCPYGRNKWFGAFGWYIGFLALRFAERGYHVVVQDTRGRFQSGGQFTPLRNEENDGLDTVAWLRQQPWFNEVLGTWGPSYLGIVQWVIADDVPEIHAVMPSVTASRLYRVTYPDGVFDLGLALRWITIFDLLDRLPTLPWQDLLKWFKGIDHLLRPAQMHLPIVEADVEAIGKPIPFFREWIENEALTSEFWQESERAVQLENVVAPVHFTGGWYDFFLRGLLEDYRQLQSLGRQPHLTIGAWHHFQPDYMLEDMREGLVWFEAHLKGNQAVLPTKPVRLYVMGAEEWREFDDFPPSATMQPFYLHAEGVLGDFPPANDSRPDTYCYDPSDPTPAWGGAMFHPLAGARDNRVLEARPDVLTYTTSPLENPLEIIGFVRLRLFVRSTAPYTDFFGRLCDVHSDGRSINICDGLFRVTPENGERQTDGSRLIEVDMWATAHQFQKGHSLRLQVSSGAHPRWNRNLGTGEPILSATQMISAEQSIYHDAAHPSALLLPLMTS